MKLLLKYACYISVILLLSCETIEDNKRLLFTGNLIDDAGEPIANAQVSAIFSNSTGDNNQQDILGQDQSDNDGNFSMISLAPNSSGLNLVLNSIFLSKDSIEQIYPTLNLFFTRDYFERVLEIKLNSIALPKLSNLEIKIKKTSSNPAILDWSLDFRNTICTLDIQSEEDINNISFCSDFIRYTNQNNPSQPDIQENFKSLRNSIAIFSYTLNDVEGESIEIPLNKIDNEFEFTY